MTEVKAMKGDATSESITWKSLVEGLEVNEAAWNAQAERLLVPEAATLMVRLHRQLQAERQELLAARVERQESWDAGAVPGFLEGEVAQKARGEWQIAPLLRRRYGRRLGADHRARMGSSRLCR